MSKLKRQTGFSLVELIMASSITLILMAMLVSYAAQMGESQRFLQAQAYLKERGESSLHRISRRLSQSRKLFGNDTLGNQYLDKLQLPVPGGGLPTDRSLIVLPTIRPQGTLVKERTCDVFPSGYFWPLSIGNSIMFAELISSFDKFGFPESSDVFNRRIDLYRFTVYYVKNNDPQASLIDSWNSPPSMRSQSLVEWQSQVYADKSQYMSYIRRAALDDSSAPAQIRSSLETKAKVVGLWDPNASSANAAFFKLTTNTAPSAPEQEIASYKILQAKLGKALQLEDSGEIFYSIAYNQNNTPSSSTYFPTKTKIPEFYSANPSPNASTCGADALPASAPTYGGPSNAFPGGFEVGITGTNSGRSVFINMTTLGRIGKRRSVEQNHSINASAKDF